MEKKNKLLERELINECIHTRINNAIDKYVAWYKTVIILVHFTEQVCEARFFMIHEFQEL